MTQPEFDVNSGVWIADHTHGDSGNTQLFDNFEDCLQWWSVHIDWYPEMARLAAIHGGVSFGAEGLTTIISHEDCKRPFHVYWNVDNPRYDNSLLDLLNPK